MNDITRDEMENLIDQYIWSSFHREVVKRRLLDGICYEPLAEEFGISARHAKRIVYDSEEILFRHIPKPDNMIVN